MEAVRSKRHTAQELAVPDATNREGIQGAAPAWVQ